MNSKLLRKNVRRAGFSLAELMVVIVILGLLATLVLPNLISKLFVAQSGVAMTNITTIYSALEEYAILNGGKWPETMDVLIEKDSTGNSILKQDSIPKDPWGNEFMYEPPSGGVEARVFTYGADGEPGGEGENADIDNIMIRNGEV